MRRIALLVGLTLLATMVALPALAGAPEATYLDTFAAQGFNGNDGDRDFSGPWVEIGESNGPTVGYVWVWDHPYCTGSFCLKMGGIDEEAAGNGAYRAVDLSGATWAKLTFDHGRELLGEDSNGTAIVQVSPDGGDTWNTVKTVSLDADDGGLKFHTTVVISDWATPDTVIRFKITEAEELEAYWLIDDVTILASFESSTTTTTEPATTTTTTTQPEATTTTTTPKATTTTTRAPVTTTTTLPPEDTDDGRTTTTVPRTATTTTSLPPTPGSDIPAEDHDTMMDKKGLAIVASAPPMAMPAVAIGGDAQNLQHAEPVEALAAAFFTDSGKYGGNLLPAIALGIVIAVVTLLGIGSRRQD